MFITSEAGELEALFDDVGGDSIAILSHPHPQYGGSMNDGVVDIMASAFHHQGINTLRFNFRGVGASQGRYSGTDEWRDVLSVANYSLDTLAVGDSTEATGKKTLLLCGYSFGAGMTYQAIRELCETDPELTERIRGCLLIAPPVQMLPPTAKIASAVTIPIRVLVGGVDQVVSANDLMDYFGSDCVTVIEQADHFFQSSQASIRDAVGVLINGS